MSTPDPLSVRGYQNEVMRHRANADRAARYVAEKVANIRSDPNPVTALGTARNLASDLAELTAALSALKALHDVEFLTLSTLDHTEA